MNKQNQKKNKSINIDAFMIFFQDREKLKKYLVARAFFFEIKNFNSSFMWIVCQVCARLRIEDLSELIGVLLAEVVE